MSELAVLGYLLFLAKIGIYLKYLKALELRLYVKETYVIERFVFVRVRSWTSGRLHDCGAM